MSTVQNINFCILKTVSIKNNFFILPSYKNKFIQTSNIDVEFCKIEIHSGQLLFDQLWRCESWPEYVRTIFTEINDKSKSKFCHTMS